MDGLLREALARYGAEGATATPLDGGHTANAVYAITATGSDARPWVLRVIREEIGRETLEGMAEWLDYAAAHGGPVPAPVRATSGRLLESLVYEGRTCLLQGMAQAPGVLAEELPDTAWNDAFYAGLGQAVGTLHRLSQVYTGGQRPAWLLPWWACDEAQATARCAAGAPASIQARYAALMAAARDLPGDGDAALWGLVHNDLHFGNICVEDGRLTILDFDDGAYGPFSMDVAMAVFDGVMVRGGESDAGRATFAAGLLNAYLPAYAAARGWPSIPEGWLASLPLLLQLKEIAIYLLVYGDYEAGDDDPWVKRFMVGRRERIENAVPYVALDTV